MMRIKWDPVAAAAFRRGFMRKALNRTKKEIPKIMAELTREFFQKAGRRGKKAQLKKTTPAQRKKWARAAIKKRWADHKKKGSGDQPDPST